MRKGFTLLLIFVVCLASANHVSAEWKARLDTVNRYITTKNVAAFKGMFTKDFAAYDTKGKKKTREEFFKEVDGLFMADRLTVKMDVKSVVERGNMADVSYDFVLTAYFKKGSTQVHEIGVDTWKKVNGKWMMAKTLDKVLTVKERK